MGKLFFYLIGFISLATVALADITAEWTPYTGPPGATVSGFTLYRNGIKVSTFPGASTTSGTSGIQVLKGDSMTLTANFIDGAESPHSSPFIINWQGNPPSLIRLRFTAPAN